MSTKTVTLFINQGGMVTCAKHGGSYLQSYLEHDPKARVIDTPLDNWERLARADVEEFDLACETARYGNGFGGECD